MRALIPLAGTVTSFISTCLAVLLTDRLLDVLPVGHAYFPDTPIHNLTYGELFATLIIIFALAYCIGRVHGAVCGERHSRMLSLAAAAPLFILMLVLAAATLGMALITFPIVCVYGVVVAYGVKRGAKQDGAQVQKAD